MWVYWISLHLPPVCPGVLLASISYFPNLSLSPWLILTSATALLTSAITLLQLGNSFFSAPVPVIWSACTCVFTEGKTEMLMILKGKQKCLWYSKENRNAYDTQRKTEMLMLLKGKQNSLWYSKENRNAYDTQRKTELLMILKGKQNCLWYSKEKFMILSSIWATP